MLPPLALLSLALSVQGNAAGALLAPIVELSADPLYAASAGDKPAMALALSVEYPTVGAQYVPGVNGATEDDTYSSDNEYLGYYDAESCYRYNDAPTETPVAPLTSTDYKRFDRVGAAVSLSPADTAKPTRTSRRCADAFSGNFLNWASNSAIDMLRLALTGGDRYIDTPTLTVLQRAVIPNSDPICMWNSTNFPAKRLRKNGGGTNAYWGAVPTAMMTAAGNNDIWIANTLNRVYFGTSSGGGCGNTGGYTLGAASNADQRGPVVSSTANQPPGQMTQCAGENGLCSGFSGVKEVLYGAGNGSNSNWKIARAISGVKCDNATFGDPITGTPKACYYRDLTSASTPWTPANSSGAANSDGFFYARVQVCESDSKGLLKSDRDYPFCSKYSSGNYKPTGAVQKYSDQLRLAAFGYLMDQSASYNKGRYGGVLRAPMKYVGSKTFNELGVEAAAPNANAEWDSDTGVFKANPDGDKLHKRSGVVNYLNQFGRTGATPGRYKIYDPVGELHYEALRYLQGLPPSTAAIAGVDDTDQPIKDGFPVYTDWTDIDPYKDRSVASDYSCLKSNIVVIGDINTHDGNRTPKPNAADNIIDIPYWRGIAGAFENNQTGTSYLDGQGDSRQVGNPNGANGSFPTSSQNSQIIGSAYWAHTHDIRGKGWEKDPGPAKRRPGLRVKTFVFDVNEYGGSSDANRRRTSNQFFMAAKYGGFETDASNPNRRPFNTQGNPFRRNDGTADNKVWLDDDSSPARVGEAQTYYLQSDARGVLNAFDAIFSRASTQARSIAGGALTNANLAAGDSFVYQAAFDTSDWSGDVVSQKITLKDSDVSLDPAPTWRAADRLGLLTDPAVSRKIFMGRPGADSNPKATSFTWNLPAGGPGGGIDTSVRNALDKPSPSSSADGLGKDRLNYLRGNRSKEGSPFRRRTKLLGDIINSGVVYSGKPTTGLSDSTYREFFKDSASRTPAVFVGANDGMLHAFDATTGDELFGYIPSWLAPRLSSLTDPLYVSSHQSYVDGQSAVAEARIGTEGKATDWATVLVGSTGNGGQGVFALDVTNPATFEASNVLWEFTDADDPDLGNVVGRPQILKFRISSPKATPVITKYFAVFGSGVNNNAADGKASVTGAPALFLLDLSKPANSTWQLGTNYFKVVLPIATTNPAGMSPGLLNFTAAGGAGGQVAQIYMGDLHGNLWKLDFSLNGSADWNIGKLSTYNRGTPALPVPYPLFISRDANSRNQPISMAPALAYGPTPDSTYVLFGTGKYLERGDRTAGTTQSFYALLDDGGSKHDDGPSGSLWDAAIRSRARLQKGETDGKTGAVTVPSFAWGRASVDGDKAQRSGWYFDFPFGGERQVSNSTILPLTNTVVFGSLIPGSVTTAGACSADPGGGNEYTLNFVTGKVTSKASTAGILGEPMVLEKYSLTGNSDNAGRRKRTIFNQVIQTGSEGTSVGSSPQSEPPAGRLSWHQISNYLDLKNPK